MRQNLFHVTCMTPRKEENPMLHREIEFPGELQVSRLIFFQVVHKA